MKEKQRFYCFVLNSRAEVIRVLADEMVRSVNTYTLKRDDGTVVGEIDSPRAWWIEDEEA